MAARQVTTRAVLRSPMRRQRIVEAATRLFATSRYEAVQIDNVARAAGVAKPTLYRYFATKEDLFLEGLDVLLGEIAGEMAAIVETCSEATQALAEMIGVLLERLGGRSIDLRLLDGSDRRFGAHARVRLRARAKQIHGSLAAVLRRGIEQEEFSDIDPDLVAWAVIGSLRMIATKIPGRRRAAAACMIADLLVCGIASHGGRKTLAPSLQAVAPIDALGVG
jgi:AcrR family transcriptional regulator